MTEVNRFCRHCSEPIKPRANVCPHCSRAQCPLINFIGNSDVAAALIAFGLLIVAVIQLYQANDANIKAEEALKRAGTAESRAVQACLGTVDIAKSIIDIADVIPRTNVGGAFDAGGLSPKDRAFLKAKQDSLRAQIENTKCGE